MEIENIEETLGLYLKAKGLLIATAESCTGGLIASRLTNIAGSSAYFLGGMVTYSNESKMRWLGVKEETLQNHGAVSRETVEEMASGLVKKMEDDCDPSRLLTIAISGIAGPDGGTPTKPVGTVWISWVFNHQTHSQGYQFHGDRISIKEQSATQALSSALQFLEKVLD